MKTIQEAIEDFILDRQARNITSGSVQFYQKKLSKFAGFCKREKINSPDEVTPAAIRKFILYLEETGHNPGGIATHFRAVRALINFAEEEYSIEWKNPFSRVKCPRVPDEPLSPVSYEDVKKLLATCNRATRTGKRDYAILLTLLDSGVRASELIELDLADFDQTDNGLLVKQGKGRKPRSTFVGETTAAAIMDWLEIRGTEPGALFKTRNNQRMTYGGLREVFRRRAKIAGIKEPTAHQFRRAFCLSLLSAGVSEVSLSRLMGHTTTQLIARYSKQNRNHLKEAYKSPVENK